MKVICLSAGTEGRTFDSFGRRGVYVPRLTVGNDYTVVNQETHRNKLHYELAEVPPSGNMYYLYAASLFGVPSDIDETELVAEREAVGV